MLKSLPDFTDHTGKKICRCSGSGRGRGRNRPSDEILEHYCIWYIYAKDSLRSFIWYSPWIAFNRFIDLYFIDSLSCF